MQQFLHPKSPNIKWVRDCDVGFCGGQSVAPSAMEMYYIHLIASGQRDHLYISVLDRCEGQAQVSTWWSPIQALNHNLRSMLPGPWAKAELWSRSLMIYLPRPDTSKLWSLWRQLIRNRCSNNLFREEYTNSQSFSISFLLQALEVLLLKQLRINVDPLIYLIAMNLIFRKKVWLCLKKTKTCGGRIRRKHSR